MGLQRVFHFFTYIMNKGFPLELPSVYYERIVDVGYGDFGLDRRILRKAYKETLKGLRKKPKRTWEMEWFLR